jgi:hypothetical protein
MRLEPADTFVLVVFFRARLTVDWLNPISAAMARSGFSGLLSVGAVCSVHQQTSADRSARTARPRRERDGSVRRDRGVVGPVDYWAGLEAIGTATTRDEARMTKAPQRPNLKRNLARTIALANGRKLKSLDDARTVILDVFGSVNARSGALEHAIRLLLGAAETGKRADTAAATDAIKRLMRDRRLL